MGGPSGFHRTPLEAYVRELREDIKRLVEEQKANAKVYGGEKERLGTRTCIRPVPVES